MSDNKLFIPLILGTTRQGRESEKVARFVYERILLRQNIETKFIDIRELNLPLDDAGEQIKIPEFSADMDRADGVVIVTPEYNRGYPGLLKHALDTNLKEYVHKAVGLCSVSAGGFGGVRVIENMLPILREMGFVTIFWDGNFSNVGQLFNDNGKLKDPSPYERNIDKFLNELVWMSKTLRYGRENIPSTS